MKTFFDIVILDTKIHKQFSFSKNELQVLSSDRHDNEISHGDMVYKVLCNKLKKVVCCLNIDIMQENDFNLLTALEYIDTNISCRVINISAGIDCCDTFYRKALYKICTKLTNKGVLIVSGFSNMGRIVYPAAFDCVIGVDMSLLCKNIKDFEVVFSDMVNIRGTCVPQIINLNGTKIICAGTSFIVPLVVAIIINNDLKDMDSVMNFFSAIAKKIIHKNEINICSHNSIGTIKKAIAFPFNKEIQNLYLNQDLLRFKLAGIYDHKSRMYNTIASVKNFEKICWEEDFDTIIIGHIQELSVVLNYNLLGFFMDKIINHKKQVIFFDNIDEANKNRLREAGIKYFLASENIIPDYEMRFGKLRYLSVPIIGLFGTSPKQGKFTLQLKLYRAFLKLGYQVGLLGSEPISKLLGADEAVICGYGASIQNNYDLVFDVNEKLYNLEELGNDIVFVSSQSQTILAGFGNVLMYPMYQESILLGSIPDGVILCVNYYDNIDYIRRTIHYIESLVDTKIIAISIFVFNYVNLKYERVEESIISSKKKELETEFNVFVFCCDDPIDALVSQIIEYLQEDK